MYRHKISLFFIIYPGTVFYSPGIGDVLLVSAKHSVRYGILIYFNINYIPTTLDDFKRGVFVPVNWQAAGYAGYPKQPSAKHLVQPGMPSQFLFPEEDAGVFYSYSFFKSFSLERKRSLRF